MPELKERTSNIMPKKKRTEAGRDLTNGNIFGELIRFAVPLFGANMLQAFYSITDMLVVGRTLGSTGLVAVGNASMVAFVVNSLCIGVTLGGTVLVARHKGAGDERGLQETVGTLFAVSTSAAAIITAAGLASSRTLFELMKIPGPAFHDAVGYMNVIFAGTFFVFGYNAVCSIMRGLGDSRNPLIFVAVAAAINIVLDLILVGPVGLGTRGAAWATVVSQAVSFAAATIHLRREGLDIRPLGFAVRTDKLRALLGVGLPAAAQMVVVNLSYLAVTGMLNAYGVAVAAAASIGLKVNTFVGMPCWAVGQAVTTMVGQNAGAAKTSRVEQTVKTGMRLNLAVTLAAAGIAQIMAEPVVALFDPANPEVLREGVRYLRICCSFNCLLYATMYTYDSFAIGMGAASVAMYNSLLDSLAGRIGLSWLLSVVLGYGSFGIFLGQALSSLLPALAGAFYFHKKTWKRRIPEKTPAENG